jgi:hypothetical protein
MSRRNTPILIRSTNLINEFFDKAQEAVEKNKIYPFLDGVNMAECRQTDILTVSNPLHDQFEITGNGNAAVTTHPHSAVEISHLPLSIDPIIDPSWLSRVVAYPNWPGTSTLADYFTNNHPTPVLTASAAIKFMENALRSRNGLLDFNAPPQTNCKCGYCILPSTISSVSDTITITDSLGTTDSDDSSGSASSASRAESSELSFKKMAIHTQAMRSYLPSACVIKEYDRLHAIAQEWDEFYQDLVVQGPPLPPRSNRRAQFNTPVPSGPHRALSPPMRGLRRVDAIDNLRGAAEQRLPTYEGVKHHDADVNRQLQSHDFLTVSRRNMREVFQIAEANKGKPVGLVRRFFKKIFGH